MKKLILPLLVFVFAVTNASQKFSKEISPKAAEETVIAFYFQVNPFCRLIQIGDYVTVKKLLELGQNVNGRSNGLTPLMFAARHNKVEIVKLLIEYGAKLKLKDEIGNLTALEIAERSKAKEAFEIIKEALEK